MDEMGRLHRGIRNTTLILMVVFAFGGGIIWHDQAVSVSGGVVIGALAGLIGFEMIRNMTKNIEHAGNAQLHGILSYFTRFLAYGVIFGLSIFGGINVIGILVGFTCHKVAIIVYSIRDGKEDE